MEFLYEGEILNGKPEGKTYLDWRIAVSKNVLKDIDPFNGKGTSMIGVKPHTEIVPVTKMKEFYKMLFDIDEMTYKSNIDCIRIALKHSNMNTAPGFQFLTNGNNIKIKSSNFYISMMRCSKPIAALFDGFMNAYVEKHDESPERASDKEIETYKSAKDISSNYDIDFIDRINMSDPEQAREYYEWLAQK